MKKTITALLLSLVTVLCLTAVAWATGLPPAPSKDDIMKLAKVKVSCVDSIDASAPKEGPHKSRIYDLVESAFTTEGSTVKHPDDPGSTEWIYTFRLTDRGADQYIYQFQQDTRYAHDRSVHFTDFTLTYDGNIGEWQMENNGIIEIKVSSCSTVAMPDAAPSPAVIETGKVAIICESNHHQQHNMREFNLLPGTYYTDETSVFWKADHNNNTGAWFCNVYLRYDNDSISRYTNPFNQANGKHLVNYVSGVIWYVYDSSQGKWAIWMGPEGYPDSAYIFLCDFPTAAELGLNVNVKCTGSGKHADKKYDTANLLADTSLDFEPIFISDPTDPGYVEYRYKVSLTSTATNGYAANYGTAVGKTHTWDKTRDSVTMYWSANEASNYSIDPDNRDSAAIAVYSDPATDPPEVDPGNPPEVDPGNPNHRWKLIRGSKGTLTVNATCDTTNPPTGGTGGGFPFKDSNKTTTPTVSSAKTFDAGAAMYAGLAILSLTGSAMVIRKKEF